MQRIAILMTELKNGLLRAPKIETKIVKKEIEYSGQCFYLEIEFLDLNESKSLYNLASMLLQSKAKSFAFIVDAGNQNLFLSLAELWSLISDGREIYWIDTRYEKLSRIKNTKLIASPDLKKAVGHSLGIYSFELPQIQMKRFSVDRRGDGSLVEYKNTMLNGYKLFLSGKYPQSFGMTFAHHVYVADASVLEKSEIDKQVDLHSAVFIKDEMPIGADLYFPHMHRLVENKIYLDNKWQCQLPQTMSFKNYMESDLGEKEEIILHCDSEEDLQSFGNLLQTFAQTGKIEKTFYYLRNECRFSQRCNLKEEPRFFIDEHGLVSSCGDSNKKLYHYKEEKSEKRIMRRRAVELTQIERNCANCSARHYCTKCSQLSDSLSRVVYCEFIRQHPELPDFFNAKNALLLLGKLTKSFEQSKSRDFIFSFRGHRFTIPRKYTSIVEQKDFYPDESNVYLFKHSNKYYCLAPLLGQVLSFNEPTMFIIEAAKEHCDWEFMKNMLQDKYNIAAETESINMLMLKLQSFI